MNYMIKLDYEMQLNSKQARLEYLISELQQVISQIYIDEINALKYEINKLKSILSRKDI